MPGAARGRPPVSCFPTAVQDDSCGNRCKTETDRHSRAGGNPDGFLVRFLRTLWMPAKGRVDSIQEPRKKHAFSSSRQTNAVFCLMRNPTRLRRATSAHKSGRHKSDGRCICACFSRRKPGAAGRVTAETGGNAFLARKYMFFLRLLASIDRPLRGNDVVFSGFLFSQE